MRRCLIVANQTLSSASLIAEVVGRQADAPPHEFHILVPATREHGGLVWTEGRAIALALALAQTVLAEARELFREAGMTVTGEVGEANPLLAVDAALRRAAFDEIIVSTLPAGLSRWLKLDRPHRIARRYDLPVTHVSARTARVG